mmetsp:Transcript_40549/g.72940  ORF Transcript_40549/g.72940 Transcript_40549/m.72940 type:complete len:116 (-) Transcript_40549:1889-2236(-)
MLSPALAPRQARSMPPSTAENLPLATEVMVLVVLELVDENAREVVMLDVATVVLVVMVAVCPVVVVVVLLVVVVVAVVVVCSDMGEQIADWCPVRPKVSFAKKKRHPLERSAKGS